MIPELVILVNESDVQTGVMEKLEAHQKGLLHRAFSVIIRNDKDEWLLQQRAFHKYHSGGLWTNACCSHPRPGEEIIDAAKRRLKEEMGIESELKITGHILYRCEFENGLTEHEYDYILNGNYNSDPVLNVEEANDFKWMSLSRIQDDIIKFPERYTHWFKLLVEKATGHQPPATS